MSQPSTAQDRVPLSWEIHANGQRVATDDATGLRFVITQVAAASNTPSEWEIEQSQRSGRTVLDYSPTLTDAVRECNLRAGRTDV